MARFAQLEQPVLLAGETGVGKELFARAIYLLGPRRERPFVRINCARFRNEELLVSELFGHRQGSFTGASSERLGLFRRADGGTVFLDEVGELPTGAQAMLLRVLGEGELSPLGSTQTERVDVRVVAATNRPLGRMLLDEAFRRDLFHRISALRVEIPAVRERDGDWELLAAHFLEVLNARHRTRKTLAPEVRDLLRRYAWPGNVREIRSVIDVAYFLSEGSVLSPTTVEEHLEHGAFGAPDRPGEAPEEVGVRFDAMVRRDRSFWSVVREPYLDRDLNRSQVREIVRRGLARTGSYKELLPLFGVEESEYGRFMDFLRHHRLKPELATRTPDAERPRAPESAPPRGR